MIADVEICLKYQLAGHTCVCFAPPRTCRYDLCGCPVADCHAECGCPVPRLKTEVFHCRCLLLGSTATVCRTRQRGQTPSRDCRWNPSALSVWEAGGLPLYANL